MTEKSYLWQPTQAQVNNARITRFREQVCATHGLDLADYSALHQWSIDHPEAFWSLVWDYCGVVASNKGDRVLEFAHKMPGAQWFPDAKLNFAENLLQKRGTDNAIVFKAEDAVSRTLSRDELVRQVAAVANYLRGAGVRVGDRVVGFMPNMPETIVAMLAATSLGAVWSSCSPDFGVQGVVDRFGQIEPTVLFAADGYYYNGKFHDSLEKVQSFRRQLPTLESVVLVSFETPLESDEAADIPGATSYAEIVQQNDGATLTFEQLPFNHPLYVMYSSGTTGVPKCIVHSAGGSLLQHLKEQQLHCDLRAGERLFYFTTCGWMMWNWLVSGLASGAEIMLYDGSPFYPDGNVLFDFAEQEDLHVFGTSAKYIDALGKADIHPAQTHQLASLRSVLSTGSPLSPESFDYVYRHVKADICLSSISGGTDILGCFIGGNPALPVARGELQCALLGMAVEVFNDRGESVIGQKGELVCTRPFPSMPVGFYGDADGSRYHKAYFDRFDNVWCHGDFIEITDSGSAVIHGRSDTVLNPGGVRIGTAEIYRQVEQLSEVQESLVIGQNWASDVRVVLFVRLSDGVALTDELRDRIKKQIRSNCTPRHVPAKIVAVADIPRTKSGKIVELAVRSMVQGESIKNKEALANPEALAYFKDLPELQR
jgi:acetoacetyl-CoA synthetase